MGYIYFLKKDNIVVYVGQTKQIESRIMQHKKDKIFDSFEKIYCEDILLTAMELMFMKSMKPKYNIMIPKTTIVGTFLNSLSRECINGISTASAVKQIKESIAKNSKIVGEDGFISCSKIGEDELDDYDYIIKNIQILKDNIDEVNKILYPDKKNVR